jgi:hypothetical protein
VALYSEPSNKSFQAKPPTSTVVRAGGGICAAQKSRAGRRDPIIHIADLASAIGAHRRTVTSILIELFDARRISKRRQAGSGGLVVTFAKPKEL